MPNLDQVAAVFTIVGGSLALIQLTAILVRLNRRPRLQVRMGDAREVVQDGQRVTVFQVITTNLGSLSARNVLWNYDLPSAFHVSDSDTEHHLRGDRVTVVRAVDHLHPYVETHHELAAELPDEIRDFELHYRIHLEDAKPQRGSLVVARGSAAWR